MTCCLNKNIYSRSKNWVSLIKSVEIRQKRKVRPYYANLYAYAANNPVRYIDPDGRKTNYSMSESGKTLLKKLEGCVKNEQGLLIAYNDSKNFATKGYGILICSSPLTDEIIAANPPQTEAEATVDFENKLSEFETIVNNRASYTYPNDVQTDDELSLTQTQADALISLTYNSPKTGKKVMDAIRAGKSNDEIKKIWMDGYGTDTGLGKRRAAEWKLYSEGIYEENPYN